MIPKIIHYCWFGGEAIPEEYQQYKQEWHQLHPGWEIMRWDETNFKFNNAYLRKAKKLKNWANISNFARLKVLADFGGIYLDTDMKLVKPLDALRKHQCFLGFESGAAKSKDFFVNNAVMGCQPQTPFALKCLDVLLATYNGSEEAHLSSPRLATSVLQQFYGLKKYGNQQLHEVTLLKKEAFYPVPYAKTFDRYNYKNYLTRQTYGVHMWGRTWLSKTVMLGAIDELQSWSQDLVKVIENLQAENAGLHQKIQAMELRLAQLTKPEKLL